MEFQIHKEDGKFRNIKKMEEYTSGLPDGKYKVAIEKSGKRSTQQNRYYWGLVIPILKQAFTDLGHELTDDDVHDFLKGKFNSKQVVNEGTGEAVELPMSTTKLNKEDFGVYIESIQRFAAEFLGVVIPDPGTQITIDV